MKNQTLLSGNIQKQLVLLAVPLLLGNILQQLYNTADSLIVGHFLGTDAFASVGVSGTIMNLFIFILNGFCVGLSVLFAQACGSGDRKRFREQVFVAISLGALVAFTVSVVSIALLGTVLRAIKTPAELAPYAFSYLMVILLGLPFTYFYNLFSGILRSIGNTKAALWFLALAIVANVVLDFLFIAGLGFGTAGAASATVLSQLLSALCCFFYIKKHFPELLCRREDIGLHTELIRQSLRFGAASALQESSLYIGKILVQGAVNTLGTPGIAAYTATMRIEGFANSFGDSGGQAMSVLISQNQGAGNQERVAGGLKAGLILNAALSLVLSVLMFTLAVPGVSLFLDHADADAIAFGAGYLRIISVFYILCFIGCAFVGYFRGTGQIHVPFLGTTLHISLRVTLSHLLVSRMGLPAIALATGLGWVTVVIFQLMMYARHRRMHPA